MTRTFTDEPAAEQAGVDESVLDNDADDNDAGDGLDSDGETLGGDESDDDDNGQNGDPPAPPTTQEPAPEPEAPKLSIAERTALATTAWTEAAATIANGDEADVLAVASVFGALPKPVDGLNLIGGRTAMELLTAGQPEAAIAITVFKNAVETVLTTVVAKAAAGPSPEKVREALVGYVARTRWVRECIRIALDNAPELPDLGELTEAEQAVLDNAASDDTLNKRLDGIGTLINAEFKAPQRKNASTTGSVPTPNKSSAEDFVPGARFEHKDTKGDVVHTLVMEADGSATCTRVSDNETRVFPASDKFIAKHSAEWVVGKGTNLNGFKHWGPVS